MGSYVAKHNSRIMRQADDSQTRTPPSCNCQKSKKDDCPVPGACNQKGVVYQATVTSQHGINVQTYVGLAKKFKNRYSKHKASMSKPSPTTSKTLSTHFLKEQNAGHQPVITWTFLEKNIPTFNPVTGNCRLCLREKFNITFNPHLATLNSRNEIFSACRHKRSELLVPPNYKSSGGWDQDYQHTNLIWLNLIIPVIFVSLYIHLMSGEHLSMKHRVME